MPSLPLPFVIKPPCEGSSVGVHIVHKQEDVLPAMEEAVTHGTTVLVEEFIQGRELTVGVLDGEALPVIHICPRSGFYDLSNKYPWMNMGGGTDYICPADLPEETAAKVQEAALKAYRAAGVEVYGRVDVLLREVDDSPFVLEINTIPGMTPSSLLPKAAAAAGWSYEALCEKIAELSLATPGNSVIFDRGRGVAHPTPPDVAQSHNASPPLRQKAGNAPAGTGGQKRNH